MGEQPPEGASPPGKHTAWGKTLLRIHDAQPTQVVTREAPCQVHDHSGHLSSFSLQKNGWRGRRPGSHWLSCPGRTGGPGPRVQRSGGTRWAPVGCCAVVRFLPGTLAPPTCCPAVTRLWKVLPLGTGLYLGFGSTVASGPQVCAESTLGGSSSYRRTWSHFNPPACMWAHLAHGPLWPGTPVFEEAGTRPGLATPSGRKEFVDWLQKHPMVTVGLSLKAVQSGAPTWTCSQEGRESGWGEIPPSAHTAAAQRGSQGLDPSPRPLPLA